MSEINLYWENTQRKVNDLIPRETSPRKITAKQMADLKKSLKKFGLAEIPVIDIDGAILSGHQRIKALQLLGKGEDLIDIRIPNRKLSQEEADQYMIGSNSLGGTWDFEKLKVFSPDFLVDIGFDPIVLADVFPKILETSDDDFNEKKELAKIDEPVTKPGDIYILGKHRLICGDCTDSDVLSKLMQDERASVVLSDPPYNLNISYTAGLGGKQDYGGNVNDDRTEVEYEDFLQKSMEVALSAAHHDLHMFYFVDQNYIWLAQMIYKKLGLTLRRVCAWVKNSQNPTPLIAFNKCYEPCVYATRGKPYLAEKVTNYTEIMNKEIGTGNDTFDDIWMAKRLPGKSYQHATSKPPTVYEKAILRCSREDDIILDSFGGSGSTLIAAEQLNRRAFLVELEPKFCDVIVKRWEQLTNKKAEIIRYEKEQKG